VHSVNYHNFITYIIYRGQKRPCQGFTHKNSVRKFDELQQQCRHVNLKCSTWKIPKKRPNYSNYPKYTIKYTNNSKPNTSLTI